MIINLFAVVGLLAFGLVWLVLMVVVVNAHMAKRRRQRMIRWIDQWDNAVLHAEADKGCLLLLEDAIHREVFHPLPKERRSA